ncbi:MAG: PHP domain-containing protein [Cetobacterium sp.]
MEKYFNYHRHSYSSNVSTIDCTVSNEDYAKRTIELGHEWISSCEHGGVVNFVDAYMTAQKHKLKYIHVGEYYFVENRKVDELKDKSNYHLILIAKNRKGFEEMNYIMSEANSSGYYYKPRIDLELLRGIPKNSVWVTTACIGNFLRDYPKTKPILDELVEIFGDNLLLEVQPHATEKQIEYNKLMKELSVEYGLKLVGACDSHMIEEKGAKDRDYLLRSKGLIYEDEEGWFLDFPNYDILFDRFMRQGIWTEDEVREFLENTLLLTESDEVVIDTRMKIPTIFEDKSKEWRLGHLKKLILDGWNEYKKKIPVHEHEKYMKEIIKEFGIIEESDTEDYFITDHYIIKKGKEKGGILTPTGRGSGVSMFINNLLGFTTIDRISSLVPMIPERFMSVARIKETKSMPDLDTNLYNREAFVEAQKEIFGEHSNYFMVAWGTLGTKSAFKMLCRAKDIDVELANEISKLITSYEMDKKHNENASIEDYIKIEEHRDLLKEAEKYNGIIDSFSQHPCAMLVFNGDIRREFGLLKAPNGVLVANVTGAEADKLGYLKNDFLIVQVVGMNHKLYSRIEMEVPHSRDLYNTVSKDNKVWDLYSNGYTMCLNQVESSSTTQKVMRYKPKTVEELCAFIASVRPSFQSMYNKFEKREEFAYGIKKLDDFLRGKYLNGSYLLYQEQQLLLLILIGINEGDAYSVLKAISKKKIDVIQSIEIEFKEKLFKYVSDDNSVSEEKKMSIIANLWQMFVDSSAYGFNSSHSLSVTMDSLYTAWVKANYPIEFYEVTLGMFSEEKNTEKVALLKNEAFRYKGITVPPMRYGQNNTKFTANNETNEIYQSMMSVKAINKNTSELIYETSKEYSNPKSFFDLYLIMKEKGLSKTHIANLSKIGYFIDIEPNKRKSLWLCNNYDKFNKKQLKKDKIDEFYKELGVNCSIIDFYNRLKELSLKETPKQLSFEEGVLVDYIYSLVNINSDDKLEEMYWECELLGTTTDNVDETFMLGRVVKYNPSTNKIVFKHVRSGVEQWIKVNCPTHLKEKDYIFIDKISSKIYRGKEYYTAENILNLTEKYKKVVDK